MDDFSFLCTTQASQNFMAEGLGTLKVHTTHVLVDFFKTLMYNLCFMIMVVVVYVPFFIFDIEKIEIEKVQLPNSKYCKMIFPLNGVSTVFSNTIKHMFDA